jgi:hypothetical protein
MTTKPKRPAHRPTLPPGERLVVLTIRVSEEQKAKHRRLSAKLTPKIRRVIDREKE